MGDLWAVCQEVCRDLRAVPTPVCPRTSRRLLQWIGVVRVTECMQADLLRDLRALGYGFPGRRHGLSGEPWELG